MKPDFFRPMGLFLIENFLDASICRAFRNEARSAPGKQATVGEGAALVVDDKTRSTRSARVSDASVLLVEERVLAIKKDLEIHFNVKLSGCQRPQFLSYKQGDFYRRHRDLASDKNAPVSMKERKVSVIIFLNGEAEESVEDSYSGGSLTFFGLLNDPRLKNHGFPLTGQEGLLVAFGADVIHEVQPVQRGERYSIVTWLD
jgi:predicted 2-oxoglutarate/Fe(II)-dependent dioxygenase YbiX